MPRARNIGSFRDRITLQSSAGTSDGMGGETQVFSTAYETWADVQELRGDRELRFGQLAYNTAYEIKVRYRNGDANEPSTAYRVIYRGQTLTIHSIIEKHESYVVLLAYSTDK